MEESTSKIAFFSHELENVRDFKCSLTTFEIENVKTIDQCNVLFHKLEELLAQNSALAFEKSVLEMNKSSLTSANRKLVIKNQKIIKETVVWKNLMNTTEIQTKLLSLE